MHVIRGSKIQFILRQSFYSSKQDYNLEEKYFPYFISVQFRKYFSISISLTPNTKPMVNINKMRRKSNLPSLLICWLNCSKCVRCENTYIFYISLLYQYIRKRIGRQNLYSMHSSLKSIHIVYRFFSKYCSTLKLQ